MNSGFTVELFDLLVYLIPGAISFAAILVLISEDSRTKLSQIDYKWSAPTAILVAFFLGVSAHIISGYAYGAFHKLTGYDLVMNVVESFEGSSIAKSKAENLTGISDLPLDKVYRFASVVSKDKSAANAASIKRLEALGIFCRNCMFPVFVLCIGLLLKYKHEKKVIAVVLCLVVFIELILARGTVMYWSATIRTALRTFLSAS